MEQKQNQNMYWRRHNLKKRLTFEQLSSENKNCQINNKVNKIITFLFIIILLRFFSFFYQSWNALLVYISYIPFFVWLGGGGVVLEVLKEKNPINVPQISNFTNSQHSNCYLCCDELRDRWLFCEFVWSLDLFLFLVAACK